MNKQSIYRESGRIVEYSQNRSNSIETISTLVDCHEYSLFYTDLVEIVCISCSYKFAEKVHVGIFLVLLLFVHDSFAAKTPLDIISDDWIEVNTENFHIITDLSQENANHFAEDLEHFRFFLLQFSDIKIKEDIPPLRMFAFRKSSSYKVFNFPKNSAGTFLHRSIGNFAVANMSGYRSGNKRQNFAQQVLRHEYVHFVFDNSHNDFVIARWYYEGMAEYLSTLRVVDGYLHYGEINLLRIAGVDFNKKVDIEALLKADRISESRSRGNDFYAHALALVHYCNFQPDMQEKLAKYLQNLGQGQNIDRAFTNAFSTDYKSLGAKIKKYLKKKKFKFYKYEQKKIYSIDNIEIRPLSTELAAFYLGELMLAIGLSGEDEVVETTLLLEKSLENNSPESGRAMLHLFHIHMEQENLEAASSMFHRMEEELPEYPGTYDAQADLYALKMDELLAQNDEEWRSYFKLARGKYRSAIHMDKNFMPAYMGLGNIYFKNIDGEINMTEGVSSFKEASYFLSYPYLDYQQAILLLRSARPREAREKLSRVIARTSNEELADIAREIKLKINIENTEQKLD